MSLYGIGDFIKVAFMSVVAGVAFKWAGNLHVQVNGTLTNPLFLEAIIVITFSICITSVLNTLTRSRMDWSRGYDEGFKNGQLLLQETEKA